MNPNEKKSCQPLKKFSKSDKFVIYVHGTHSQKKYKDQSNL